MILQLYTNLPCNVGGTLTAFNVSLFANMSCYTITPAVFRCEQALNLELVTLLP